MKILYHHRTQAQCAEGVHIREIVDAFRDLGHQVDVVSPPGVRVYGIETSDTTGGRHVKTQKGIIARLGCKLPEAGFEVLELLYNLYSFLQLHRRLSSCSYDLIYERYSLFGISSVILSKLYRIPLVIEVNDATVIQRSRPLSLRNLAKCIEKKVFRNANIIITITHRFKRLLLSHSCIRPESVMVLPNAIDPKRFDPAKTGSDIKQVLGIRNRYIIGVVGAFVPWHGLEFLLQSLHTTMKEYDIHLLLVGDGPIRDHINRMVHELGLTHHVTITGFVDPQVVPNYIAAMDICLMPNSNKHGCPIKILEYMAMGKPVIAPKYEPIEEIITNDVTGILFPPLNSDELKTSVIRLLADKNFRQQLGDNAGEKVMAQFKWTDNVAKVLNRLLPTPQPASSDIQHNEIKTK